jgi:hypothetical protein
MEEFAVRNQTCRLTPAEHDELMNYVKAGHLLAFLHSKARKALKKRKKLQQAHKASALPETPDASTIAAFHYLLVSVRLLIETVE